MTYSVYIPCEHLDYFGSLIDKFECEAIELEQDNDLKNWYLVVVAYAMPLQYEALNTAYFWYQYNYYNTTIRENDDSTKLRY